MDIICVAFPSFEGDYVKSTVELMRQMAQKHRVLYVDYAYTWKDLILGILGKKKGVPIRQLLRLAPRLTARTIENGHPIFVMTPPPMLPVNFLENEALYSFFSHWNGWKMKRAIRRAMHLTHITEPVVINAFNPFFGKQLVGKLNERKRVYYCYDEISACAWAKTHGARLENDFIPQNDALVVSSKGLYESKKAAAKACYVVNNGVDDLFFNISPARTVNQLGYIGSIDSRLDYELLYQLAFRNPDKELVMVGRVVEDKPVVSLGINRLTQLPNVRFEGAQSPQQLVNYLAGFSAGLIPFVKNEQTAAIYPMKINEYLAAGLPVISTDFAPLSEFTGVVDFENNIPDFCARVNEIIATDSAEKQARRVAFALQNTWATRADELETILSAL
ncbi:MAG: glycosyltransferase [Spirosomataceae bacterium]